MENHNLEPRDEIDGHLSDVKELLRAAIIVIDDLDADDENVPQNLSTAAIGKIEKVEKLLEDQVLTKRKAA
jgi:uncharacterized protein (UPF0147 family)